MVALHGQGIIRLPGALQRPLRAAPAFSQECGHINVELIYRLHHDEAFAEQFTAKEYSTFVAMPFKNEDRYDADRIYNLIQSAGGRANELAKETYGVTRQFATPKRVGEHHGAAIVITEAIARQILEYHFFLADLSSENAGVVLETGVAMGLKPTKRLILVSQQEPSTHHFDVRDNHITQYNEAQLIDVVAKALVGCAVDFEAECKLYITAATARLTPDAILCLNRYGQLWNQRQGGHAPPIYEAPDSRGPRFQGVDGEFRFHDAVRELLSRRLLWTDYRAKVRPGVDAYGMHATELGWKVIEHVWPDDFKKPSDAPTHI